MPPSCSIISKEQDKMDLEFFYFFSNCGLDARLFWLCNLPQSCQKISLGCIMHHESDHQLQPSACTLLGHYKSRLHPSSSCRIQAAIFPKEQFVGSVDILQDPRSGSCDYDQLHGLIILVKGCRLLSFNQFSPLSKIELDTNCRSHFCKNVSKHRERENNP